MTAKEMFEQLGYIQATRKDKAYIFYDKPMYDDFGNESPNKSVWFSINYKTVRFSAYRDYNSKELQATQKQIEELGWLE